MDNSDELQTIVTVAAKGLLLREGRALLVQRSQTDPTYPGMWEFPGGRVEFGEDPKDALVREIQEETGLSAEVGQTLYVKSIVRNEPLNTTKQIFIINYLAYASFGDVSLSFEHENSIWATKSEMAAILSPAHIKSLKEYNVFQNPDIFLLP